MYGATGAIGSAAVQLLKYFGAIVTAVCNTKNIELVKSLGADVVIDYQTQDFTKTETRFNFIFDAVGKIPRPKSKKALAKSGFYLSSLAISGNVKLNITDLNYLKELCEAGKLKTVIDRVYKMDQIVEAHRYVDKGHKKGNVVLVW